MPLPVDPATEFGARVERRLREDTIGWLVTSAKDGAPQPNPVWFLWDGETVLIYSQPGQAKLKNIERNPAVAFNLDSQSGGDDIVILTGTAAVDGSAPKPHEIAAYVAKYEDGMRRLELGTPEEFSASYSVAIRVTPTKVRGF